MKKYLLILIITALYGSFCNAQSSNSGPINATISSPAANQVLISLTNISGSSLPAGSATNIVVYIRVAFSGAVPTVSITTNNFTLGPSSTFNGSEVGSPGFFYFGFEGGAGTNLSSFPNGVAVPTLGLTVTNGLSVELVGGEFAPFPPGSIGNSSTIYFGTAVTTGATNDVNLVNWPISSSVTLPIRLQSFTAQKLNYNSALLNWKSLSEENASHFEIEKSLDAENWVKAGTEKTRGSLNYGAEYSFRDEEALMTRNDDNTVYYRLKMVDLNGSYEYSDIRLVTFDRNLGAADAYPNPSFEFFNWKMSVGDTQENDAQLHLFDMTGKLVKKQTVSANGISKVDIAELETGLYNIVVKHGDEVFRKRIIKTN